MSYWAEELLKVSLEGEVRTNVAQENPERRHKFMYNPHESGSEDKMTFHLYSNHHKRQTTPGWPVCLPNKAFSEETDKTVSWTHSLQRIICSQAKTPHYIVQESSLTTTTTASLNPPPSNFRMAKPFPAKTKLRFAVDSTSRGYLIQFIPAGAKDPPSRAIYLLRCSISTPSSFW